MKVSIRLPRLLVIILPILIWVLAQSYLIWPEFFYISSIISVLSITFVTFYLKQAGPKTPWWFFTFLPVIFLLAISVYITLCTSFWLIQILFLVLLIFQFNYFKSLYYFWNKPELYSHEDMKTVRAYGGFLSVFFLAANIYGLQSLLNFDVWPMLLIFVPSIFALVYISLRLEDHESKTIWQFASLISLVMFEMAWVFIFLPLNYNVSGLSVSIVYYLIINLVNLYLQKALVSKKIKLYIFLSSAGLMALLFTANWLN
jgi:hypothetical protein